MNKILLSISFLFAFANLSLAQPTNQLVDQIVAVVGNEIILQSNIEGQLQEKRLLKEDQPLARCELLKQAISQKLILTKARFDSVEVSGDQVDQELNRRVQYFINMIGSETALEDYYDKSLPEIKDEMRESVRELLLVQRMRSNILGDVKVTPAEVKKYYKSIPEDSLPVYNTEVEVSQIILYPKPIESEKKAAIEKLEEIRGKIMSGDRFENFAILYSEDPSSSTKGGDLGMRHKDDFVPRFSAAAIKLSPDSVSGIVESQFGYHLIKMIERKGDNIHVKHILIKPKLNFQSRTRAKEKLDSIRAAVKSKSDTLTFKEAAYMYSEDEVTKNNGGVVVDPETGASNIEVDKLDASLFFVIDTMEVGEISAPHSFTAPNGREGYRIIHLIDKIEPHKANMEQDYPKLKRLALTEKKVRKMQDWEKQYARKTYVRVIEDFRDCSQLELYY